MRQEARVFAKVPTTIGGRRIPARFRDPLLRLDNPVEVLREFIRWVEGSTVSAAQREPPQTAHADERDLQRLRSDRSALVSALVELSDLVDSAALREKASRALVEAGVTSMEATGERFNPSRHRAVSRIPAPDGSRHAQVAETERPGYSDRGRVIRPPEVLVYWLESSGDGD
jgi:hypothetical protein